MCTRPLHPISVLGFNNVLIKVKGHQLFINAHGFEMGEYGCDGPHAYFGHIVYLTYGHSKSTGPMQFAQQFLVSYLYIYFFA